MKALNVFGLLVIGACSLQACQSPESRAPEKDSSSVDSGAADSSTMNSMATSGGADDSLKKADITNQSGVEGDDATFMKKAAIGGMMEVDAGKMALKSTNTKVKAFAEQMVADHTKANNELKAIAAKKKVLLPEAYPAEEKAHLDMMKSMTGTDFDKHYIEMMVTDHDKTIALFNTGAASADNEVSAFAKKTLPVIKGHFEKAKTIKAGLK
jgi:putative membrane protein